MRPALYTRLSEKLQASSDVNNNRSATCDNDDINTSSNVKPHSSDETVPHVKYNFNDLDKDSNNCTPSSNLLRPPLIPEIALRITALRETFEETGLLLAVPVKNGKLGQPLAITEDATMTIQTDGTSEQQYSSMGGSSIKQWRSYIQDDASKVSITAQDNRNDRFYLYQSGFHRL